MAHSAVRRRRVHIMVRYPLHVRDALDRAYAENPDARGVQIKEIASKMDLNAREVSLWFMAKRYRVKKRQHMAKDKNKLTPELKENIVKIIIIPSGCHVILNTI